MDENKVREIIKDETNNQRYQSGNPVVSRHQHDGIDNVKVQKSDIIVPNPVNGSVDMAQVATYTFNLTKIGQVPSSITFYGGALNVSDGVHAMIVGNAQFGANQQFQTQTATSVVTGPVVTNIIQGSASMTVINGSLTFDGTGHYTGGSNAKSFLKNSQGHIIYAEYPSTTPATLVAVADVIEVSNSAIKVQVTTLASGWSISGFWLIT